MRPSVQWKGDNAPEIERLLRQHVARATKEGDQCHVTGLLGLDVTLDLGDRLVIEGDRLGVLRTKVSAPDPTITWDATNLKQIAAFLKSFRVRFHVSGVTLLIRGEGDADTAVLNPGDRLIERAGQIIVSKAGKDHRV